MAWSKKEYRDNQLEQRKLEEQLVLTEQRRKRI